MTHFFNLTINEIRKETANSVSISLNIPDQLKGKFTYDSGQYITLKHIVNNEDVIRSYSLCSSPFEDDFRIGVKKIEGGKMSTYLNDELTENDSLEVMLPEGRFSIHPDENIEKHYIGIAAGSGITPVLSMIKSVLLMELKSTFTLYYVNKDKASVMFQGEIETYLHKYPDNFKVINLFTREETENSLYKGRIDKDKFMELMRHNKEVQKSDGIYICGPEDMIFDVNAALQDFGVSKDKVHYELFGTPTDKMKNETSKEESDFSGVSQVKVIMDGEDFEFDLANDGDFVLDAAMNAGADAPFSCKGAVCCTCKAQVLEGKVTMDMNYSLSDEEVANGFILTCQARPASENVVIDYDVI